MGIKSKNRFFLKAWLNLYQWNVVQLNKIFYLNKYRKLACSIQSRRTRIPEYLLHDMRNIDDKWYKSYKLHMIFVILGLFFINFYLSFFEQTISVYFHAFLSPSVNFDKKKDSLYVVFGPERDDWECKPEGLMKQHDSNK